MIEKLLRFWIISFLLLSKIWNSHNIKSKVRYLLPVIRQLTQLLNRGPILALLLLRKTIIWVHVSIFHLWIKKIFWNKNLKANKVTQDTDIQTKLIKENSEIFADFIFENLNDSISQSVFPSALKLANITPVHKKYSKSKKDHYRPISALPSICKIYERFFFKQISEYFEQFLSKYQCGFRKVSSA